jgi:NAD(P)H-hydrate epimerase
MDAAGRALVSCADMASADRAARERYGIPAMILMENAACSAADYLLRLWKEDVPVLVAAGKGNNGGDALAIARRLFLAGRRNLRVLLLHGNPGELPRVHLGILEKLGVPISVYEGNEREAARFAGEADWIIDGLYGIGLRGPVRDSAAALIKLINDSPARVVALDVPSGLGDGFRASWPVVRACHTLTFEAPKLCLYLPLGRAAAGRIEVLSAGFPPQVFEEGETRGASVKLVNADYVLKNLLPRPRAADYKNSRGHVAVFAGSPGTTGAALLCGEAVLRAGAGLASLFAAPEAYPVLAPSCRSLMVKPRAADPRDWDASACKAILAGPGWGRAEENAAWLKRFFADGLPGVLDADALHILAGMLARGNINLQGWVLTPHPGEFAVLSGADRDSILADPIPLMREFCRKLRCVLALKTHVTIIHDPGGEGEGRTWIHDGMNSALGTAGSGDVLAGLIAGLLGRSLAPAQAALCGVELHAAAGKAAARISGFFTSEELLQYISKETYRDDE